MVRNMLTSFFGVAKLIRMGLSIKTQKRQMVEKKRHQMITGHESYFSIQIKSGKKMSILLYVSLRKTVVTVGHRGLRVLRRQFKTSGSFLPN